MRRALVFLPLLLCACGAQDSMSNSGANSTGAAAASGEGPASSSSSDAVQTATLTGLYESGPAGRRNQICVIEHSGGESRFGLVVWGSGSEGCSGAGTAERQGEALRFTMAGDEACTIEARIDGRQVSFPASLQSGCAYYCSRGARLGGATFEKTGGTAEDAMRAQDLVGDRLCAGGR